METLLYDELVPFYHLLDPLDDHADEGAEFGAVLRGAAPSARALLELGSGAGHGAHFIKERFEQVTLTDLSEPMLDRSRALNPECEHLAGDMRTLRLGRRFDCVMIHDAISYLASLDDLKAMAQTVLAHLSPEGAALLVPDCLKETFIECHEDHAGDDAERSLRCLSWSYDPDPADETHLTDFAFLLRAGGEVWAVHDRHVYGLFDEATWIDVLQLAGLDVAVIARPLPPEECAGSAYTNKMFLCRPSPVSRGGR